MFLMQKYFLLNHYSRTTNYRLRAGMQHQRVPKSGGIHGCLSLRYYLYKILLIQSHMMHICRI
jgi:hypothetical protein